MNSSEPKGLHDIVDSFVNNARTHLNYLVSNGQDVENFGNWMIPADKNGRVMAVMSARGAAIDESADLARFQTEIYQSIDMAMGLRPSKVVFIFPRFKGGESFIYVIAAQFKNDNQFYVAGSSIDANSGVITQNDGPQDPVVNNLFDRIACSKETYKDIIGHVDRMAGLDIIKIFGLGKIVSLPYNHPLKAEGCFGALFALRSATGISFEYASAFCPSPGLQKIAFDQSHIILDSGTNTPDHIREAHVNQIRNLLGIQIIEAPKTGH